MKMFILGAAVALLLSSVGINGTVRLLEQGVAKAKEYTPVVESTFNNIKSHAVEAAK